MKTELVFILDESGSMYDLKNDVIGGFNSMIDKQKELDDECYLTVVAFNNKHRVIYDRVDLHEAKVMGEDDYCPSGSTALMDTMADSIKHIEDIHRYIRKEDVPEKTIFMITTDGYENASTRYQAKEVRKMVESKEKDGWEFIFLAANIDAVETAKTFGIKKERAASYVNDSAGVCGNFVVMDAMLKTFRTTGKVEDDWAEKTSK